WNAGRYDDMYRLLSSTAKQAISQERFVDRYRGIVDEATIKAVHAEAHRPDDPNAGRVPFAVTFTTGLWGDIHQDNEIPLSRDPDGWRIDWSPSLIFKELTGANLVRTFIDTPARGAILDRHGQPLAVTGSVPV